MRHVEFSAIVGHTITKIDGLEGGSDSVRFHCADGTVFTMYHGQDCCESVGIEDIAGDVNDLLDSPVVRAEEPCSLDGFGEAEQKAAEGEYCESSTWTFYILGTAKGTVTLRWLGTSNGYYSEGVSFEETPPEAAGRWN